MQSRQAKGLEISARASITQQNGVWSVPSQHSRKRYTVRYDSELKTCNCPDYEKRKLPCKHVYAVAALVSPQLFVQPPKTVRQQGLTYKQSWREYNLAQTNEKAHFQELLYQLCQNIDEPVQTFGRPRMPLKDVIFGAAYKIYSTISGRRQQSDLKQAHARGLVSRSAHYNTIFKYLDLEMLTPYLHQLIRESSQPLKAVESDFAVDSSGFRVKGFVRWFNTKYGKDVENHDWLKVHLMCGVKTNIVTSVEITNRHANDNPYFEPLVNKTVESGFRLREVSADSAYSSRANLRLVKKHEAMPYVDFKENSKGGSKCATWNSLFHYYSLHREEFYQHYHKRSNVESTFWMIKSKFGEQIRSKVKAAQENEALLKVLCHNICVVIQSMYEFGIDADFVGKSDFMGS